MSATRSSARQAAKKKGKGGKKGGGKSAQEEETKRFEALRNEIRTLSVTLGSLFPLFSCFSSFSRYPLIPITVTHILLFCFLSPSCVHLWGGSVVP